MKEFKVEIPKGYEIDEKNSTFECIKFRPKQLCYIDVAKQLFDGKIEYYLNERGNISSDLMNLNTFADANNCITRQQAEKLIAFNKLLNVASYLNDNWKPNLNNNSSNSIYFIFISNNELKVDFTLNILYGAAIFKSEELAKKAIEILGEETIKIALS